MAIYLIMKRGVGGDLSSSPSSSFGFVFCPVLYKTVIPTLFKTRLQNFGLDVFLLLRYGCMCVCVYVLRLGFWRLLEYGFLT